MQLSDYQSVWRVAYGYSQQKHQYYVFGLMGYSCGNPGQIFAPNESLVPATLGLTPFWWASVLSLSGWADHDMLTWPHPLAAARSLFNRQPARISKRVVWRGSSKMYREIDESFTESWLDLLDDYDAHRRKTPIDPGRRAARRIGEDVDSSGFLEAFIDHCWDQESPASQPSTQRDRSASVLCLPLQGTRYLVAPSLWPKSITSIGPSPPPSWILDTRPAQPARTFPPALPL